MDSVKPKPEELKDLSIESLGERTIPSPIEKDGSLYEEDGNGVLVYSQWDQVQPFLKKEKPPMFETAGPRSRLYFDPAKTTCGIITCGGLCPGLNDVIRTVTLSLQWQYGVKKIWGFRYGYNGLSAAPFAEPKLLSADIVDGLQHDGGTILGSSRGGQTPGEMVEALLKYNINILFTIGGDGTFAGAMDIADEVKKRRLPISVVGIPKTIDNDIYCAETSFGFSTAVEEARKAIYSAHSEAKAAWNGIGLVKLMGRDSGFIAVNASLANSDVNICLIPEVRFSLEGENGLFSVLEKRLNRKHHAVIVAAEGAGQRHMSEGPERKKDASGNIKHKDIGLFLKDKIAAHFKSKNIPVSIKHIDPSYIIRSGPANAFDSTYCLMLGRYAVHAGMAGKTNMFVGYWNHQFTHVPLHVAVHKRKKVNPHGDMWQTVLETTEPVS